MKIDNDYKLKYYSPVFTSCGRDVYGTVGQLMHRNDTSLFRRDLGNWDKFAEYIGEKFKNVQKANIYSLSSSAGDEVYSLIMKLIEKYGENNSKKFFPIIASDYDSKIIKMAKEGFLPMYEGDDTLINRNTNGKFNEYFEVIDYIPECIKDMDIFFDFIAKVKPILRDKVVFKIADATEECKLVEPNNSIVMARNFWPYLKDENKRIQLANNLYKTLDKNSAVVIGHFDDNSGVFTSKNLYDAGFRCNPENYCIYEKNIIPSSDMYYLIK